MSVGDQINKPQWVMGWNGKVSIAAITVVGGVIGQGMDMPFLLGALAFFASPFIWYFGGVRHVNNNYESVLNRFHERVDRVVEEALSTRPEDNAETYRTHYERGSKILRKPSKVYETHTLVVTDHSLIIHDDAELEMPSLNEEIGDSTEEFYFDSIASVNYDSDERQFWVNLADGHGRSWPSDRKPEDCMEDVQKRLRDYKRQAAQ
ncbi:uncharacterized protein HHUB_2205 [Halobacterium hubeiense]|uniref:Uncharacterized protein n=1 Tax=Halobacterium hubeiense TaxID=1407499 RepID=A0A0U5H3L1_9EURY|nr:hypothetical protein [Halobacterium hubeiense]CQH55242.1 uncharacterized protein HHUB_2205 [Halobacterium hubeiense]